MSTLPESSETRDGDVQSTPPRQNHSTASVNGPSLGPVNGIDINERGHQSRVEHYSSPSRNGDGLLPAFSSRQFSHLPTPQSPNNVGIYANAPLTPESPLPTGSHSSHAPLAPASFAQRLPYYPSSESRPAISPSRSQQILTPESSPLVDRGAARQAAMSSHATLDSTPTVSQVEGSNIKVETTSLPSLAPAHSISPPAISPTAPRSALSSPFMAKLSLGDFGSAKSKSPYTSRPASPPSQGSDEPIHVDDVFSTDTTASTSTLRPPFPHRASGGEMERIRLQMMEHSMAQFQETENRRPEYLKRMKRSLADTDPALDPTLDLEERESVLPGVGVTVSPMKGRRLKLFQETSEESFEESLMAGGYDRYDEKRNADWIKPTTPGPGGSSAEPINSQPILSEKELRKQRRLAAFSEFSQSTSKLQPVEVEGKGRILLDTLSEDLPVSTDTSPTKKKAPRRKKKGTPDVAKEVLLGLERGVEPEAPNWPDSEFPWALRVEEHTEKTRATQQERLRWIEKFLDRDSDDDDEGEDEEILPSTMWGQLYEDAPMPARRGRGKMVGLKANPSEGPNKRAFFPSDPADARAALMSKRSVRTLSYRTQRRLMKDRPKTWEEDSDDEESICFCHGRDDGRGLVQCDACQTWYHLQCIGIENIRQLGKEEDPWFCKNCTAEEIATRSPSPELLPSSEPTFVPTDDRPTPSTPRDPLFFSSLPGSPSTPWGAARPPTTPTRGESAITFSSGSSTNDPARIGPSTPYNLSHGVRVYTTPGPMYEPFGSDDTGFDPTSTPSRGIKFGPSFATPKNTLWSARAQGLFQTPSRSTTDYRGPLDSAGNLPLFSSPYRPHTYDDSPIRRVKPAEGHMPALSRRFPDSPMAPRFPGVLQASLQESPVVRSTAKNLGPGGSNKSLSKESLPDPE